MPAYAFAHMNVRAVETACIAVYRVDEDGIKVSRCIERRIIVVLIPGINGWLIAKCPSKDLCLMMPG